MPEPTPSPEPGRTPKFSRAEIVVARILFIGGGLLAIVVGVSVARRSEGAQAIVFGVGAALGVVSALFGGLSSADTCCKAAGGLTGALTGGSRADD